MNNKEYLNEEQYKKTKKKLNMIGNILLCVGIILAISSIVLQMTESPNEMLMGILGAPGFFMIMIGIYLKYISHWREISAFTTQQQMPIVKESIEKMAPSVGVAAKEIAKGVKEGLKDEDK